MRASAYSQRVLLACGSSIRSRLPISPTDGEREVGAGEEAVVAHEVVGRLCTHLREGSGKVRGRFSRGRTPSLHSPTRGLRRSRHGSGKARGRLGEARGRFGPRSSFSALLFAATSRPLRRHPARVASALGAVGECARPSAAPRRRNSHQHTAVLLHSRLRQGCLKRRRLLGPLCQQQHAGRGAVEAMDRQQLAVTVRTERRQQAVAAFVYGDSGRLARREPVALIREHERRGRRAGTRGRV